MILEAGLCPIWTKTRFFDCISDEMLYMELALHFF